MVGRQQGVPIAVGKRGKILNDRIEYGVHHPFELIDVFLRPFFIGIPENFGGIGEFIAVNARTQYSVFPIDGFAFVGPSIDYLDGLFGIILIARNIPGDSVVVSGRAIR